MSSGSCSEVVKTEHLRGSAALFCCLWARFAGSPGMQRGEEYPVHRQCVDEAMISTSRGYEYSLRSTKVWSTSDLEGPMSPMDVLSHVLSRRIMNEHDNVDYIHTITVRATRTCNFALANPFARSSQPLRKFSPREASSI